MPTTRTLFALLLATALTSLAACERPDAPGERMDEQEFPDPNVETDGEPFDDTRFGEGDQHVVEPGTRELRDDETAAPNAPQGLAPGAYGVQSEGPERLDDEAASEPQR